MPLPNLSDAETEAWCALLRAPKWSARVIREGLARHRTAATLLSAGPAAWRALGVDPAGDEALLRPAACGAERDWLADARHHLLTWGSLDYPPLLARTPDPPAALWVDGDPTVLWLPQLAVVGSRSATAGGLANARDFAATFARAGLTVTSGLAEGVDGAAHEAALKAGGTTVAVFGTGIDRLFPRRHAALAARIAGQGALVSEFPLGTEGLPSHFPRRNRIIAGLALGTLVVEAGLRSGTLVTARCAAEAGREVFAIPGSIHNPLARGCHRLIREGAKLVEGAPDVLDELAPLARELGADLARRLDAPAADAGPVRPDRRDDPDYACLLDALGHDPQPLDVLAARTGLTAAALSSMLLMLELEGIVVAQPGGYYGLCC
ncbi:MAG: DNA-processing protein DprA [Pseudomonadota bacterium]